MPSPHMHSQAGIALVTVLGLTFVLAAILAGLCLTTGSHALSTRRQENTERAFFIAEAGVERAAQHIANGGTVPVALSGTLDEGTYVCTAISGSTITDAWHSISGQISINPNNNPNHEFSITLPDGSLITRDMLVTNYPGYIGNATLVHVNPKGGGNQNELYFDGAPYPLQNNNSYDIISDVMSVSLYNDLMNSNGMAMGKWWISIAAAEATLSENGVGNGSGNIGQARVQYSILAVGTVRGEAQTILRETIQQKTWAEYALWMSRNNGIYFISGEKFYGPVHSNERLNFNGSPEFFDTLTSSASTFSGSTNACIFHLDLTLNTASQSMQSISFSNLKNKASLVLTGTTAIAFSNGFLLTRNDRRNWTNEAVGCDSNRLIYIETATTGTSSSRPGDLYLGGQFDGRITLVCERDVYLTNHITYAADSKTNLSSDDAIGIIASRDISVTTSAPSNLTIYAHMMATGRYDTNSATDGSFGVINYNSGSPRGRLTVHGGIVQDDRGAVGTFDPYTGLTTHGFYKDYTYDTRFKTDPPPDYPPLSDELQFGVWRQR